MIRHPLDAARWVDMACRADTGLCSSQGPRIGAEDVPRCRQPIGHDGPHCPGPDDGYPASTTWGDL